jgi:hypothetical protein
MNKQKVMNVQGVLWGAETGKRRKGNERLIRGKYD